MGHTEVFLALPAQADYVTLTVPDPFNVVHQLLVHIAPDATPLIATCRSGAARNLCQSLGLQMGCILDSFGRGSPCRLPRAQGMQTPALEAAVHPLYKSRTDGPPSNDGVRVLLRCRGKRPRAAIVIKVRLLASGPSRAEVGRRRHVKALALWVATLGLEFLSLPRLGAAACR